MVNQMGGTSEEPRLMHVLTSTMVQSKAIRSLCHDDETMSNNGLQHATLAVDTVMQNFIPVLFIL
jgi:hypothetical protein